jgi:hypothetical protein
LSCAIHFTHRSKNRRDQRRAGFRIYITSSEVAQRPVAGFGGDAGCDGFWPLGSSVLPDGLIVVFIPPVAPVAPPVPVPVVDPDVPEEAPLDVPTPPADAPPDAPPVPEPPAPCARTAVDEIANASPKVIAANFMKLSF